MQLPEDAAQTAWLVMQSTSLPTVLMCHQADKQSGRLYAGGIHLDPYHNAYDTSLLQIATPDVRSVLTSTTVL